MSPISVFTIALVAIVGCVIVVATTEYRVRQAYRLVDEWRSRAFVLEKKLVESASRLAELAESAQQAVSPRPARQRIDKKTEQLIMLAMKTDNPNEAAAAALAACKRLTARKS